MVPGWISTLLSLINLFYQIAKLVMSWKSDIKPHAVSECARVVRDARKEGNVTRIETLVNHLKKD